MAEVTKPRVRWRTNSPHLPGESPRRRLFTKRVAEFVRRTYEPRGYEVLGYETIAYATNEKGKEILLVTLVSPAGATEFTRLAVTPGYLA